MPKGQRHWWTKGGVRCRARKRASEVEAAVLRAKALSPEQGDSELGAEFGLERRTVYRLLKEHGLQDLHRVRAGGEKRGPKLCRVKREQSTTV